MQATNTVILSVMYLNQCINRPIFFVKKILLKTAIFIAVFSLFSESKAQEYNNWLLSDGAILNFNTSPATIICNENNSNTALINYTVSLSDENGKLILYGFLDYSNTQDSYVLKNADHKDLVVKEKPSPRNVIGCKLPQGGYCIAAVFRTGTKYVGELYAYIFDNNGNLVNEYIYKEGNYSFFIDFIRVDDFMALVAYRNNQIETYKLTSDGCYLWNSSELLLDKFIFQAQVPFDIEHSLDNSIIIATTMGITYVLSFNKNNGEVTITHRFDSDKFEIMSFSPTDKYFLVIDDDKLKGFKYSKDYEFILDNPDIIYDLPKENNVVWEMAVGVDGKLYIHAGITDYIIVLDGIESENITKTIIRSDCLKHGYFPRIPRIADTKKCKLSAMFDNATVCYGEPLKIIISGSAPFEVSYTLDGELKNINTDNTEYQIDNIPGSYKLTKITDSKGCEIEPDNNNSAEILPKLQKLIITKQSN